MAAVIVGCGQQNPQMIQSSTQPGNITIQGTLYPLEINFVPSFSLVSGEPIAGAHVRIDGDSGAWTTISDANGQYRFVGVPDGSYLLSVTVEGYLYGTPATIISIKPIGNTPAEGTVNTQDIALLTFATIIGYSPAPGSTITANQTFEVTFNAPMDTSTVRFKLIPQGIRSSAIDSGSTVQVDLNWSDNNRKVAITPKADLIPNENYRLQMDYSGFFVIPPYYPLDARGEKYISGSIVAGPGIADILPHFADYKTAAGGVPSAPSSLQVLINEKPTSEVDAGDVLETAADMKLNWSPSAGNVTGYRVYIAKSGSRDNYVPLEARNSTMTSTTESYFKTNITKVINALYGAGAEVNPVSTGNYPLINNTVYFKVVAYNGDGESAGPEVAVRDVVGPQAGVPGDDYVAEPFPGQVGNGYYFPPIDVSEKDRIYIFIREPVDPSTVIKDNFTLTGGGGASVISANFMMSFYNPSLGSFVEIKASGDMNGQTLTMANVKDLAGNVVKTGVGDSWSIVIPHP